MKPLQHAQISAKIYGGLWTDYIEIHNFLDSSKSSCAHFKHRFLLHHGEGIELAVRLFGELITNGDGQSVSTRQLLTEHLTEDVGKLVSIEDWAQDFLPKKDSLFYQFLTKKRAQIEADEIKGERELLNAFNLSDEDISATKAFRKCNLHRSPRIYFFHQLSHLNQLKNADTIKTLGFKADAPGFGIGNRIFAGTGEPCALV